MKEEPRVRRAGPVPGLAQVLRGGDPRPYCAVVLFQRHDFKD